MPVGGIHVDSADHSVWAATDPGPKNRSEIVHFDENGKLIERYAAPGPGPHDLNDLVLSKSGAIYVTDTYANQVYRFDRKTHSFSPLTFPRPIFYPNGITISADGNFLFAADMLGVLRVDLRNNEAQEVRVEGHYTLAGIDGLYWYHVGLVGVQYGAGAYRVVQWHLTADGLRVAAAEMLEYRTCLDIAVRCCMPSQSGTGQGHDPRKSWLRTPLSQGMPESGIGGDGWTRTIESSEEHPVTDRRPHAVDGAILSTGPVHYVV